jgi:hypothetical protein
MNRDKEKNQANDQGNRNPAGGSREENTSDNFANRDREEQGRDESLRDTDM